MAMIASDTLTICMPSVLKCSTGESNRKYIYMNNKLKAEKRKESKENHISNPNHVSPHGHP